MANGSKSWFKQNAPKPSGSNSGGADWFEQNAPTQSANANWFAQNAPTDTVSPKKAQTAPAPKPSLAQRVENIGQEVEKWGAGTNPEVTRRAYAQMKRPGIVNKVVGGTEYLVSGIPFAGAPLAQAMQESGAGEYKKSAIHTAEAIPQIAMLPLAGEKILAELTEDEAAKYLPEAQKVLLKSGQATLKRAPETAATDVAHGPSSGLDAMLNKPANEAAQTASESATVPSEAQGRIAQNVQALSSKIDPAKIQSPGDVDRVLDAASSALVKNPEMRSAPISFPEQQKLAQGLGLSDADLLSSKADQPFKAEELVAAKAVSNASLADVLNEAQLADDPAHERQFFESVAKHQAIQDQIKSRLSETGRALGAARNEPNFDAMKSRALGFINDWSDAQKKELVRELTAIPENDTGAMNRFLAKVKPSTPYDKLHEAWLNGLLTGGAVVKKTAADSFMLLKAPLEKALGGDMSGAWHTVLGNFSGWSDAVDSFAETFRSEMSKAHGNEFEQARQMAIKGPLGRVVRTPVRLLAAITDFAHSLNYAGELNSLAYKTAVAEGLSGDALTNRAAELFANPTDEMQDAAFEYARKQTFQSDLKGGVLGGIKDTLATGRRKIPGGRWALPFLRTPMNIIQESFDFSPIGLAKVSAKALRGDNVAAQQTGKALLGSAAWAWAFSHAARGDISGAGPSNYQDRLRLEAKGWQPYSIKVGNRWVSYRYLEPLGAVLSSAAEVAEKLRENPSAPMYDKIMTGLGSSMAAAATGIPFFYQFSDAVGIIQNFNISGVNRTIGREVGSLIPTAVADIAHATDRTVRVPNYYAPNAVPQYLETRIPGLSENVPALRAPALPPGVRNSYGLKGPAIQRPTSQVGGFNPFPVSKSKPALQRLERNILQNQRERNRKRLAKVLYGR